MPFLAVSRRSSPFQHQKARYIYSCVSSGAFSYYRLLTLEVGERGGDVWGLVLGHHNFKNINLRSSKLNLELRFFLEFHVSYLLHLKSDHVCESWLRLGSQIWTCNHCSFAPLQKKNNFFIFTGQTWLLTFYFFLPGIELPI